MIKIPYLTALSTYFSYGLLFVFGHFRDFFRKILDCFHSSNLQVLLFFIYFFYKTSLASGLCRFWHNLALNASLLCVNDPILV